MRILYRGEQELKWHDGSWDGTDYYIYNKKIRQTNIVSVDDMKEGEYVKCSACGEIMRNTPHTIRNHKKKGMDHNACFKCKYLRLDNLNENERKYSLCENGKYMVSTKAECTLTCNISYSRNPIESQEARRRCQYALCANATFPVLKDFFGIYPGAFDEMITVDKIIQNGYKTRSVRTNYDIYELKSKNSILAYVNKQNIVTYFTIRYKNCSWSDIVYSPKYNKLFDARGGVYCEWNPNRYDVPVDTQERIKNKIASLYD